MCPLMQHVDDSKLPEEQKVELQKTLSQVASANGQQSAANTWSRSPRACPKIQLT